MLVLEAGNIKKFYGERLIIEFEELKIYSGDKIGIVGQNGSGKTTLMDILSRESEPDEGFIKHYCGVSYIRQFSDETADAEQRILKEFNVAHKTHQKVLSGGEHTRIKIANALAKGNLLVFADEPTTNLDYKGIELLRQKLSGMETFLLVSHDRNLLNSLCNKIIEIRDGRMKLYNGNYSFYKQQNHLEFEQAEQDYEKYVGEKANLEAAISDRRGKSKAMKKTPSRMGNSEARLHKRETTEKQKKINNAVNSMKTRLEKLEMKEKPKELTKIKLDFSLTNPPENKIVISAEKLRFSYGSRVIFEDAGFKIYKGSKTALWGENGTGKTTLLNLVNENSRGDIYTVPRARIGYFHQGLESLEYDKSVLENVMKDSIQTETTARTILARLLISGHNVYKKAEMLSGGERIKVSFAKIFVSDANVLLLDEPTNYLDMKSLEALESVLRDYEGTVVFVSHDREFVNSVATRLFVLENHKVTEFEGSLAEFELGRQKKKMEVEKEMESMALKMKIADVVAKLSWTGTDKEALEEEYELLIRRMKQGFDT